MRHNIYAVLSMRIIPILLLVLMSVTGMAQTEEPVVMKDPKNGRIVLKGPLTYTSLTRESSFDWLQSGQQAYRPNARKIKILKDRLTPEKYQLVVFMGTWCADTHELLPQFFKVLQQTTYPAEKVVMYGVERDKTTRSADVRKYNVVSLPTFIVLDQAGNEKGRITESVNKSIESDLVHIIN